MEMKYTKGEWEAMLPDGMAGDILLDPRTMLYKGGMSMEEYDKLKEDDIMVSEWRL